jgi:hypothetical protein
MKSVSEMQFDIPVLDGVNNALEADDVTEETGRW